jgi:hypothetical protein
MWHAWKRGKAHNELFWRSVRKIDSLGDQGVDGSIILKWILKKWDRGIDWIDHAQGKERWRVLSNAVMKLGFHKMLGRRIPAVGIVVFCDMHCRIIQNLYGDMW